MAAGRYSPELLQKIKDSVSIHDVVGEYVVLRKTGANYIGLCPFHSERTPSFTVSATKPLYHCYGCKKGGDLINFVMEMNGLSFFEAVEELADRARIPLPKDKEGGEEENDEDMKRRKAAREKAALAHKLNRFVASFFRSSLSRSPETLQYLAHRGVNDEVSKAFYVGLAPPEWSSLSAHLHSKKAPVALATELGLIRASSKGAASTAPADRFFDLFRGRAVFPIIDLKGKVVAFGGRTLPFMESGGNAGESPKYLNSTESFIFQKSKVAFGLFQAQKFIRETDTVILVEGYFDVLAMHAAGFQNVVATCGTALTPDHLNLFKRLAGRIIVLFDADRAGEQATERAMETGLAQGMAIQSASLPDGLDPDEVLFDVESGRLLPDGKEKMAAILAAARPILDVKIDEAIHAGFGGSEARTQSLKKIANWLNMYADTVGREVRIQAVVDQMAIPRTLLEQAMGGSSSTARAPVQKSGAPGPQCPAPSRVRTGGERRQSALGPGDRLLLKIMPKALRLVEVLGMISGKMPPGTGFPELFDHPTARAFAKAFLDEEGAIAQIEKSPERLLDFALDSQVREALTEALLDSADSGSDGDLRLMIDKKLEQTWARFSQRIKDELAAAEARKDGEKHARLMKEYLDVQRKMKEFSRFYDQN